MRSGDRPGLQMNALELLAFVFYGLGWCRCCILGAVWHPLSLIVQCIVQLLSAPFPFSAPKTKVTFLT
jgi:hypothetical protein